MLNRYFIFDTMPDPLLWTEHDPWLVALSLLVAMGGASVAMHLADLAGKARLGREREWTLASGALALGSSMWAMHYIGMLAFGVCGAANFDGWFNRDLMCGGACKIASSSMRRQASSRASLILRSLFGMVRPPF